VIVPVFNERATAAALLERVLAAPPAGKQILVVDDGSTDGTRDLLAAFVAQHPEVQLIFHDRNRGKGAAIRTAIPHATGRFTIVQDADLEYDPADFVRLLAAAEREGVRVVYGSRIRGGSRPSHWRFYIGGIALSWLASLLYWTRITDEPTCYKLIDTEVLKGLPLREDGFGFCPEVTALLLRRGERLVEVPISYAPRRISEGKKIRWHDGLEAIWILLKHRFTR
jgi:glycosyltransferase involved in cell wall biosynthesis